MRQWQIASSRLAAGALVLALMAGACSSGSDDDTPSAAQTGGIPAEATAGT